MDTGGYDGIEVNNVARWDGTNWYRLGGGVGWNDLMGRVVYAMAWSSTHLYVGGWFSVAGSNHWPPAWPAQNLARWDGEYWEGLGTGNADAYVYAIAVSENNEIDVGGMTYPQSLLKITESGDQINYDEIEISDYYSPARVYAIAVSGQNVYVGGTFNSVEGTAADNIAVWNGTNWSALELGVDGRVQAISASGTDVYVGGEFTAAGGSAASNIAKWDGATWSPLGSGLNGLVRSLAWSPAGVYAGGDFFLAGGKPSHHFGRWLSPLTVFSPNGGESWDVGSVHTVVWNPGPYLQTVQLYYSTTPYPYTWQLVSLTTPNTGRFEWTVPNTISETCFFNVRNTESMGIPQDISDLPFRITGFRVTSPNNGEHWLAGSQQTITWDWVGEYQTVMIEYSTDNGSTWTAITPGEGAANTGSYPWTVPLSPSAECLVRVSDADGSPQDLSDATFMIAESFNYGFVTKWGTQGSGDGQLNYPYGIGVAGSDVYVVDRENHRIQRFTSEGAYVAQWGSLGSENGQFNSPNGIAIGKPVYVADTFNHRIQLFDGVGDFKWKWGTYGSGDGQFIHPRGIAVDKLGFVYVAEYDNHRIQKFSPTYAFVTKWGSQGSGDGEFIYPDGMAVDNNSGYIYVADERNHRIQKFTLSGGFVAKWGIQGSGDGQFNAPLGVAVDSSGYVYVADTDNHRIQKFSPSGVFITKWGSQGSEDGQFQSPKGIAVDSSGYVYVSDSGNHRIQKFQLFLEPVIAVTSPNGGESWETGTSHNINWTSSVGMGNVMIDYSLDDGATWEPIEPSTPNSGTYSWTVPNTPSATCRVRVSETDGSPTDASDAVFSIVAVVPTITVTSPNGGETWAAGSVHSLTWTSAGAVGNVKIEYSIDNGSTWTTLAPSTANDGSEPWPVPNSPSSQCRVRIAEAAAGSPMDMSDGAFSIAGFEDVYEVAAEWGSPGSEPGQFNLPKGVAVDTSGFVYVADEGNHRVQRFTPGGVHATQWGGYGSADGQFIKPKGVAADSSGFIYVADTDNHRIQKFYPTGNFVTKWGSQGSEPGQFFYPCGVAVNSSGSVYVSDTFNHRIQRFTSDGVFAATWGSNGAQNGEFSYPVGIAVDSSGWSVYVADEGNHRVQKFTSDGVFVATWGSYGSGDGQFKKPSGVAVDASGFVYVTDADNHRIQKFSASGVYITQWGSFGSEAGQFNYPYGIAVDSTGSVFVADMNNNRIQKFQMIAPTITITSPNGGETWEAGLFTPSLGILRATCLLSK